MTVIKVKNSNVAGRLPSSGDLVPAELALNLQDKKLYSKDTAGEVFEIGVSGDVPSGDDPPSSGNNAGDLWFKTDDVQLLYWNGSDWEVVFTESGGNLTGDLTLGTDKITLNASTGEITAAGQVQANGGLEAYIPTNNLQQPSQRWFDNRYGNRDNVANMNMGGSLWVKQSFSTGSDPTKPQVTIDSAGDIITTGDITASNGITSGPATFTQTAPDTPTGYVLVSDNESAEAIKIYEGSTKKLALEYSGSITTVGSFTAGSYDSNSDDGFGVRIQDDLVYVQRPSTQSDPDTATCFATLLGKNVTSRIFADGSAEFAGDIQSGGRPGLGTPGVRAFVSGLLDVCNADGSYAVFRGLTEGSTQETSRINANGSAKFDSYVEADLFSVSRSAVANKDNYTSKLASNDTGKHFNAKDAGSVTVASIGADGSAEFAKSNIKLNPGGAIQSVGGLYSGFDFDNSTFGAYIQADGTIISGGANPEGGANDGSMLNKGSGVVCSFSNASSLLYRGYTTGNSTPTFTVTAGGTVTPATVIFNLEPENTANYTTTTETYTDTEQYEGPLGRILTRDVEKTREIKEYTGPTMDVKQTLLDITGALENLKAAAASATTIAELRDAIETSLANV